MSPPSDPLGVSFPLLTFRPNMVPSVSKRIPKQTKEIKMSKTVTPHLSLQTSIPQPCCIVTYWLPDELTQPLSNINASVTPAGVAYRRIEQMTWVTGQVCAMELWVMKCRCVWGRFGSVSWQRWETFWGRTVCCVEWYLERCMTNHRY